MIESHNHFILAWINFIILITVIFFLSRTSTREFFRARKERIRNLSKKALTNYNEAKTKYAKAKSKLAGMEKDRLELRRHLIETGSYSYDDIVKQAHETAERIKRESQIIAENEAAKIKQTIEEELFTASFRRAEDIIASSLTENIQKDILKKSIEELKKVNLNTNEHCQDGL